MTAVPMRGAVSSQSCSSAGICVQRRSVDYVTVLATDNRHSASKRFVKTANVVVKHSYNAGYYFGLLQPQPVTDIFSLSDVLTALEDFPRCLVIRGAPTDTADIGSWTRRTGSNEVGNFFTPAEGRRWILIDLDKIALPQRLSLTTDPVAAREHLVRLLPAAFQNTTYHWQFSSSAGMGDPSTVSMHLWFWLVQPATDSDLKAWAKHVNEQAGYKLVDPALFQHVQAHYTAAPIFEGMADPFPVRSGLERKTNDSAELVLPTPMATRVRNTTAKPSSQRNADGKGYDYHLSRIGDHPGGEGFHAPIVAAAASYVGTHGKDGTDVEVAYKLISNAVVAADATHHDAAYIEHMASREHIVPAIASAVRKFGDQPAARRKASLHSGVAPHYSGQTISATDAQTCLIKIAKRGI